MVGKLDIGTDNGDYAFDIRAARAAAEGAGGGGGQIGTNDPIGPYGSSNGADYWFRTNINTGFVQVGWDIDSDPDPDIWRKLTVFLRDTSVGIDYRNDVEAKAYDLGWDGTS